MAPAAHVIAMKPSAIIILENVVRPSRSLITVRETSVACVEWKPDRMPQVTVTKKIGMKLSCMGNPAAPASQSSVSGYPFTDNPMNTPTADSRRMASKIGYTLPMILSMGKRAATT